MERYVGMDVSLKETSICVVDGSGQIVSEGTVISEPEAIANYLKTKAKGAKRIGLETGPATTWLWHELRALGLPVICIDARHAKAALSLQINKSDRNDAVGLARIMQAGWYKEVQVKSLPCHEIRAVLNSRAQLVKVKRDLENQIRGLARRTSVSSLARPAAMSSVAGSKSCLAGRVFCGRPFDPFWRSARRSVERSPLSIRSSWAWHGTTRTADVP